MRTDFDAIIVGAGPAGLACGTMLSEKGLEVAVLDEQATPGGQIYRNITRTSANQRTVLGDDYTSGLATVDAFGRAALEYLPRSRVWQVDPCGNVYLSRDGASQKLSAPYLVLCTGAMERPVPFPGWMLPGVMTCGGMSNLYKDSGLVPAEPLVLAGSGPFLWLVAEHLLTLDAPIEAILDTSPLTHAFGAVRALPAALKRFDFLFKGVKMIGRVRSLAKKKNVEMYRNVKHVRAVGREKLEQVQATVQDRELRFNATTLLVTEGIIPNTALFRQVGCSHAWNPVQRYWHPDTSANGRTNLFSVFVAGDGAFVHGAKAAEYKGQQAALAIAKEMHRISDDDYQEAIGSVNKNLERELYPRPFIDKLYRPRHDLFAMPDDTLVCRCEGISAGRIRDMIRQGYTDHNEIKAIIRCGMGPCQGRMCGAAIMELIVEGADISPVKVRQHRLRPPIKPVSLMELANAELGDGDEG